MSAATAPRRATNLSELRECLARFGSDESHRAGLAFRPRADDVFIATYPKCGTTWVQQIVHQLRTGGDMDFTEITAVVPWLEMAGDLGQDPGAPQVARPRAYKTHLSGDQMPRGGRCIVVVRDPRDVLVSLYRFFEGWIFEPGSIGLGEFALGQFVASGSRSGRYWQHLLSWWPRCGRGDTLFLAYEQMLGAPGDAIERIARFSGVAATPALFATVLERSSLAFMRRHAGQFDDHLVRDARNAVMGLPPGGAAGKVRAGTAGGGKALLEAPVLAALDAAWAREIEPALGFARYEELAAAL